MLDPTVATIGTGLLASVVAGKGLVHLVESLPRRWRTTTEWLLVVGAAVAAIVGDLLSDGPGAQGAFVLLIAALPGTVACLAWRTVVIAALVGFLVYPTVAPRPAKMFAEGFAAWCLQLDYSLDSRYNCFPSLHVAHSFVSALASYHVHRGVGLVAVAWASLIGVSTLYTKQHYAVDVTGGALGVIGTYLVVVACFWVLYRTRMVVL